MGRDEQPREIHEENQIEARKCESVDDIKIYRESESERIIENKYKNINI